MAAKHSAAREKAAREAGRARDALASSRASRDAALQGLALLDALLAAAGHEMEASHSQLQAWAAEACERQLLPRAQAAAAALGRAWAAALACAGGMRAYQLKQRRQRRGGNRG
mmetsp:Transcript_44652/g.69828  ORF Transcript_44652/g.69828 Transcript_44652/m.69828 type:complete len:113 (+) Transcript_44652:64-402(+)